MSERGPSSGRGTRVSGSVIAGLLLVPATAIAAVAIVGATARPPAAEAIEEVTETTEVIEDTTTSTLVDVEGLSDAEALEKACTESAEDLIERELDESIDELEIAALDALRQICDEHGMTITGPPEPEPIVKVVTVKKTPTTTTTDAPDDFADDDDEYEDHDDDDDDDEREDYEREDHEDEEDEEDEDDEDD